MSIDFMRLFREGGPANNDSDDSNPAPPSVKEFAIYQFIPTNGAYDWEYFTINNEHYLAVANLSIGSSYNTNSCIYKAVF